MSGGSCVSPVVSFFSSTSLKAVSNSDCSSSDDSSSSDEDGPDAPGSSSNDSSSEEVTESESEDHGVAAALQPADRVAVPPPPVPKKLTPGVRVQGAPFQRVKPVSEDHVTRAHMQPHLLC